MTDQDPGCPPWPEKSDANELLEEARDGMSYSLFETVRLWDQIDAKCKAGNLPRDFCTWEGLLCILDTVYPESLIPTTRVKDEPDRDIGARIVALIRWVADLKAANAKLVNTNEILRQGTHDDCCDRELVAEADERYEDRIEQLTTDLAEARGEVGRLRAAIMWALGVNGSFAIREEGQGAYYWRRELRKRAKISAEELTVAALNADAGDGAMAIAGNAQFDNKDLQIAELEIEVDRLRKSDEFLRRFHRRTFTDSLWQAVEDPETMESYEDRYRTLDAHTPGNP